MTQHIDNATSEPSICSEDARRKAYNREKSRRHRLRHKDDKEFRAKVLAGKASWRKRNKDRINTFEVTP